MRSSWPPATAATLSRTSEPFASVYREAVALTARTECHVFPPSAVWYRVFPATSAPSTGDAIENDPTSVAHAGAGAGWCWRGRTGAETGSRRDVAEGSEPHPTNTSEAVSNSRLAHRKRPRHGWLCILTSGPSHLHPGRTAPTRLAAHCGSQQENAWPALHVTVRKALWLPPPGPAACRESPRRDLTPPSGRSQCVDPVEGPGDPRRTIRSGRSC